MPAKPDTIRATSVVTRRASSRAFLPRRTALVLLATLAGMNCPAAQGAGEHALGGHEQVIRAYYSGWERKEWETVVAQLAAGFTFTSPAPDDHIPTPAFRAKCWNQAGHIDHFEFVRVFGDADSAILILHVVTTDRRAIRNVEYFTFRDGKIASIEVFFGGSGQGYPTNSAPN